MTAVEYVMGAVERRLEDDAGLGHARGEVIHLGRLGAVVVVIAERVIAKRARHHTRRDGPRGGLELAGALPLGALREPEHEPVIGVILLGEVRSQEESYGTQQAPYGISFSFLKRTQDKKEKTIRTVDERRPREGTIGVRSTSAQ